MNTLSEFQVYKTVLLTSTEPTHLPASWYPLASVSPFLLPAPNPVPGYHHSTLLRQDLLSQIPHVSDPMQYLFLYLLYFTWHSDLWVHVVENGRITSFFMAE